MQCIRALVGTIELRSLTVHAVAGETRFDIEWIAFVRPPAIHAESEGFAMRVPGATDLLFVVARDVAEIVDSAAQFVFEDHRVEDDAKVFLVEFVDGLLRIGKNALVPRERTVLRIPAGRTKTCAEINERVAREFLLAKSFRFGDDLVVACECSMRLLVAERPERRQLGMAGEPGVFGQEHSWFLRDYEENVERQSACEIFGDKFAFGASEIEYA